MKHYGGAIKAGLLVGLIVAGVVVVTAALWRADPTGSNGSGLGPEFGYNLDALRKTDPNLVLYREAAKPIATSFKEARSIAVGPDGVMYVAGDQAVRLFSPEGTLKAEMALPAAPRCLAVTAEGKLYVGLTDHIEVYDTAGKKLAVWESPGPKTILASLAVGSSDVFAADAGGRVVLRYDLNGKLVRRIGAKDAAKNIGGFVIPSPYFDVALAPDGLLRAANTGQHRIEAYTFEGDLEFSWGQFGNEMEKFCGCCNPINFALLGDEGFVTAEKGLTRVKVYDGQGKFKGVVAGAELFKQHDTICEARGSGCNTGGLDVAADQRGRIYVLDPYTGAIRIFEKK